MSKYVKPWTNRGGATITSAADLGVAPDSPWYAVCDKHSTLAGGTNRDLVAKLATVDFCDCCKVTCIENSFMDECGNCGRTATK